jgi:hypothetical protein
MTFDYETFVKEAQDRLEKLYEQKVAIEQEIGALEGAIQGFGPLLQKPYRWLGTDTGITEAITAVFKVDPSRLFSPPEIRDELLRRGVSLEQKNPMATIHQILARLVERGAVMVISTDAGRNHYKWVEGWETKKFNRPAKTPGEQLRDLKTITERHKKK